MKANKLFVLSIVIDLVFLALLFITIALEPYKTLTRIGSVVGLIMVGLVLVQVGRMFNTEKIIIKPVLIFIANVTFVIMGLSLIWITTQLIPFMMSITNTLISAGFLATGSIGLGLLIGGMKLIMKSSRETNQNTPSN